jgi:GST-like protein
MLEVWSWPTPNGHKVHIALEELGLEYKVIPVDIGAGDQFKPEFLKITPNHRIPALVDPDGPGGKPFTLFESAAILIYLSERNGGQLTPKDPIGRYKCLEWMMFFRCMGRAHVRSKKHFGFTRSKDPHAISVTQRSGPHHCATIASRNGIALKRRWSTAWLTSSPPAWIRGAERRSIDLADYPRSSAGTMKWQRACGAARRRRARRDTWRGPINDAERENYFGKTQFAAR